MKYLFLQISVILINSFNFIFQKTSIGINIIFPIFIKRLGVNGRLINIFLQLSKLSELKTNCVNQTVHHFFLGTHIVALHAQLILQTNYTVLKLLDFLLV
jgi:hypothetical protein